MTKNLVMKWARETRAAADATFGVLRESPELSPQLFPAADALVAAAASLETIAETMPAEGD